MVRQLGGKELSFNNVLDLNAGRLLVGEFELPACAIIKHNNPCGCAVGGSALEAYQRAFACDPLSAFGGVICLNRPVDARARRGALEPVRRGRVRAALHRRGGRDPVRASRTCASSRTASGGGSTSPSATSSACSAACSCRTATWTSRTARRWRSSPSASRPSASGARCCSPGRSASTCARTRSCSPRDLASVGIGAGQMSRVDSVRIAIEKAAATEHRPDRRRARLGRVLPVLRRPAAGGRRGRHGDHPAGRLQARPRGRRGRRRRRHLDGLHAPPPLQALTRCARPRRARAPRAAPHASGAAARGSLAPMDPATIARAVAIGRAAIGAALLAAPRTRRHALARRRRRAARRRRSPSPALGARDLALGAGTAWALGGRKRALAPVAARRRRPPTLADLVGALRYRDGLEHRRRSSAPPRSPAARRVGSRRAGCSVRARPPAVARRRARATRSSSARPTIGSTGTSGVRAERAAAGSAPSST